MDGKGARDNQPESLIRISLIGRVRIVAPSGTDVTPRSRKARAILGFLLLNRFEAKRKDLMRLLWSDRSDEQARASLRQCIMELRQVFREAHQSEVLLVDKESIALKSQFLSIDLNDDPLSFESIGTSALGSLLRRCSAGLMTDLEGVDPAFDDWLAIKSAADESRVASQIQEHTCHAMVTDHCGNDGVWANETGQNPASSGERALQEANAPFHRDPEPIKIANTAQNHDELKVAVLPIKCIDESPDARIFCDGFTGDIIVSLSQFREFAVIAQHSSFSFRHATDGLIEVARHLDCPYAVTGNLQLSEQRMRVRVQLQTTHDGRVIWSDRFTGHIGDTFAFQDEITEQVVARLAPQIREQEWRRVQDGHIPPIDAYDLVLRGQNLGQRYSREANLRAFKLFEGASFLDPCYGRSYAGISRTFNLAWRYRWHPDPGECLRKAVELAQLAVRNDPMDARAHSESGFAYLYLKQHGNSISAYERALELNCNDADIIAEFGDALVYDGRPKEAVACLERAMRLNPIFPDWYLWNLADAYNAMQSPEKVIATVERMRDVADGRRLLIANYAHLGLLDEAKWHANDLLREQPGFSISNWAKRPPYKNRKLLEHYMDGLRRAGLPET